MQSLCSDRFPEEFPKICREFWKLVLLWFLDAVKLLRTFIFLDSRTYFIDALILNKTLTRDRQISVNFNSSQWLWNLLEQNENVWIAVAAINRNGQGVLGAWAEYRPSKHLILFSCSAEEVFMQQVWFLHSWRMKMPKSSETLKEKYGTLQQVNLEVWAVSSAQFLITFCATS